MVPGALGLTSWDLVALKLLSPPQLLTARRTSAADSSGAQLAPGSDFAPKGQASCRSLQGQHLGGML